MVCGGLFCVIVNYFVGVQCGVVDGVGGVGC